MSKFTLALAFLVLTSILLSGCFVKSLHPTYQDSSTLHDFDSYHFFQPLSKNGSPAEENPWKKNGEIISKTQDGKESDRLRAIFFKVGKYTYLDVTPESISSKDASMFHLIPAHCIYRVTVKEDLFKITPFSTSSLAMAIKNKDVTISHIIQKDGNNEDIIVTATPAEWKIFLESNGDRAIFFQDDDPLLFRGFKTMPVSTVKK